MGVSKEKKKITLVSPFNKTIDPNTVQAKLDYSLHTFSSCFASNDGDSVRVSYTQTVTNEHDVKLHPSYLRCAPNWPKGKARPTAYNLWLCCQQGNAA